MTTPIAYQVCTFGLPLWDDVTETILGRTSRSDLGPRYLTAGTARRIADLCPGSGTCTNARVAVIYRDDADPDISLAGGPHWEWLNHMEARIRRQEAQARRDEMWDQVRDLRAVCRGVEVTIDRDGYLVHEGDLSRELLARYPHLTAAQEYRAAVLEARS